MRPRMLDRRFIRENPERVEQAAAQKGVHVNLERLLELDVEVKKRQHEVDDAHRERRQITADFRRADQEQRADLKRRSAALDQGLKRAKQVLDEASAELNQLLLLTPMIPWEGAPVGPDESFNQTIRVWGEKPRFDFEPLDHVEFCERRGWVDFVRGRKVSGERGYALIGELVQLERAIHTYAIDLLVNQAFKIVGTPALVREETLVSTGFFPLHRDEVYSLPADNLFLAGTAEVGLVGMHADEVLDSASLPILYAGISPCFRREVGSAGRDVRGLLRVHQFEKVEQFVICEADDAVSDHWHQQLLGTAETILQAFDLHYEVVECATGDMGLGKYRMNDINTWFPSLSTFRETHSCSTLHDWQSRRARIRYKDVHGRIRFAHTLNNTAVATPRLLAALIENHQTADTRLRVPSALQPYLGNRTIL